MRGVLFHCDAVQAVGKAPVDTATVAADYLSLTGHKINAPKGIGALYVRRKAPLSPLIHGGHQEKGLRGGTENVAFIAALGKAAALAAEKAGRSHRPMTSRLVRNSLPDEHVEATSREHTNQMHFP